jgi:hypothetical protein
LATRLFAASFPLEWWLLAVASVTIVFAFVAGQRSDISLLFEARSPTPGSLQIFHAADGQYSKLRAHVWPLQSGVAEQVSVTMPTRDVRMLRLDPAPGMTEIKLCDMRVRLSDGRSLPVLATQFRASLETTVSVDGRCVVLTALASAGDHQASVDLSPLTPEFEREEHASTVAAFAWPDATGQAYPAVQCGNGSVYAHHPYRI